MFSGELLPYQHEAVDRMCERGKMLVAYDLGLGKTVLTIAAVERLMDEEKITEPGLVICLSSLKYQWAAQIKNFTNGTSKALVIDGTPSERAKQYAEAMDWRNTGVDYIIMNYEQVTKDLQQVLKLPRGFVVADEATAIKSFKSQRTKAVKKLKSPYTFALTGTPVENGKPEELFSIMQFVDPEVLGRFDIFDTMYIVRNHFGGVQKYKNLDSLNADLKTACVRKRQEDPDVAPFLPETIVPEPIWVPMTGANKKLYEEIVADLLADLEEASGLFGANFSLFDGIGSDPMDEFRGRIMSKLTAIRMLCDDPYLIRGSANLFNSNKGTEGSQYASELLDSGKLDRIFKTPKLDVLKETVINFLSEDPKNKIVIFASFVSMTNIIAKDLMNFGAVTYTGRMNAKEKESAKIQFQTDPNTRIFISSDAGGYGVDLPQANLLINYDLPWNAGLAAQRNGRIRRASSTWSHVVIQDILMKDSIEERQHAMLKQKLSVASAIIDGEGILDGGVTLTVGSLKNFLQNQ